MVPFFYQYTNLILQGALFACGYQVIQSYAQTNSYSLIVTLVKEGKKACFVRSVSVHRYFTTIASSVDSRVQCKCSPFFPVGRKVALLRHYCCDTKPNNKKTSKVSGRITICDEVDTRKLLQNQVCISLATSIISRSWILPVIIQL